MKLAGADAAQLAQQIEEARNELHYLEDLLLEVPEVYEAKFRRQLAQLQFEIAELQLDQQRLLQQIASMRSRKRFAWIVRMRPTRRIFTFAVACALGLSATGLCLFLFRKAHDSRQMRPVRLQALRHPVAEESLIRGGLPSSIVELMSLNSTWIEVADNGGRLLLRDTLEPGRLRRIRLRQGLRLFTANAPSLRFRIDDGELRSVPSSASGRWIVIQPLATQTP